MVVKSSTILAIASSLAFDYENKSLVEDQNNELYYCGMTEDYCGQMYEDLGLE